VNLCVPFVGAPGYITISVSSLGDVDDVRKVFPHRVMGLEENHLGYVDY